MRTIYTVTLGFTDKNHLYQSETHRFGTYDRAYTFFLKMTLQNAKFIDRKGYVPYAEISFKEVME